LKSFLKMKCAFAGLSSANESQIEMKIEFCLFEFSDFIITQAVSLIEQVLVEESFAFG